MTRLEKLKKIKAIYNVKGDESIAKILNYTRKRLYEWKFEKRIIKDIDTIFDLMIENHELKECFVFSRNISCDMKYKKHLKAKYLKGDLKKFSYRVVK